MELIFLVTFLSVLTTVVSFNPFRPQSRYSKLFEPRSKFDDFDSSELEFGSSSKSNLNIKPKETNQASNKYKSAIRSGGDESIWNVAEDSAEIEVESSSSLSRRKEIENKKPLSKNKSLNPPQLSASEKTGFDYGLLVAFPLMIGSLAFFLFFPTLGPILSGAGSN